MLKRVNISNLAIIDNLSVEFDSSFNVITGESGSGKTVFYKAINYLFGATFKKSDLRNGEKECIIEGILQVGNSTYSISRLFTKTASKSFLDKKPISKKEYQLFLNDFWESYGQHEKQHLVKEDNHIKYLDRFSSNIEKLNKYQILFNEYNSLLNELDAIKNAIDDYNKNKELYEFQLNEIDKFNIYPNQDIEINDMINETKKIKKISDTISRIAKIDLSNSNIIASADNTIKVLSDMQNKSPKIIQIIDRLENMTTEFSDIQYELAQTSRDFYYNENDYNKAQEQLVSINELKRKYGGTIDSVLDYKENLLDMISKANNSETLLVDKANQKNTIKEKLIILARELLKKRKAGALELEKKVKEDLKSMDMEGVEFMVNLGDLSINETGVDSCVITIRTNKGELLDSLGKIASGGELSRIMMAIKLSMNSTSQNKMYILDEIDSGLSGKEADSIGMIIKKLSKNNQVICITHLSQIASKADRHFKISKSELNDRTFCEISLLNAKSKINELAVLISGKKITDQSIGYAKKMLGY